MSVEQEVAWIRYQNARSDINDESRNALYGLIVRSRDKQMLEAADAILASAITAREAAWDKYQKETGHG